LNFSANWIWRDVVKVDVMSPALGETAPEEVKVVITGHPKLG
jgi:hypothetical protein